MDTSSCSVSRSSWSRAWTSSLNRSSLAWARRSAPNLPMSSPGCRRKNRFSAWIAFDRKARPRQVGNQSDQSPPTLSDNVDASLLRGVENSIHRERAYLKLTMTWKLAQLLFTRKPTAVTKHEDW